MLGFVSNMIGPRCNPIGVDFGTETLRLAQVATVAGEMRVIAAACADVPSHIRNDPHQRLAFLVTTLKELLSSSGFRGRQAVLGLPSAALSIVHLRVPMMDDAALKKVIPFEARGKLPFDPTHAVVRHLVAGEVYHGQEQKLETIVMASPRSAVEGLLAAAGKAKLDVVGLNVEALALMDCFSRLSRRADDKEATSMYVDIGASGSRAIVARHGKVMFARAIPVGGDHFTRAVSQQAHIAAEDAKLLRLRVADLALGGAHADPIKTEVAPPPPQTPPPADEEASTDNSFALLGAGLSQHARAEQASGATATLAAPTQRTTLTTAITTPAPSADELVAREVRLVETAVREPLARLVEELDMCRRYHDATFPSAQIDRLVFIGGEARQRGLCAFVARELALAATVGDPMARMSRVSHLSPESGLDRRGPQPAWAVALGLSMGPLSPSDKS